MKSENELVSLFDSIHDLCIDAGIVKPNNPKYLESKKSIYNYFSLLAEHANKQDYIGQLRFDCLEIGQQLGTRETLEQYKKPPQNLEGIISFIKSIHKNYSEK